MLFLTTLIQLAKQMQSFSFGLIIYVLVTAYLRGTIFLNEQCYVLFRHII